jgi:hypothetical protein
MPFRTIPSKAEFARVPKYCVALVCDVFVKPDLPALVRSRVHSTTKRDRTSWLGREDSNLCISESDPLLSIMA